jgi:phosphoglycolate phosphatase
MFWSRQSYRCPLCGSTKFKDYRGRVNAACARCGAKERHRLLGLTLPKVLPSKLAAPLVHMAPEAGIARLLWGRYGDFYRPVDFSPEEFRNLPVPVEKFDLARPLEYFAKNSVEVFLHSHVAEHIFAPVGDFMRELNRAIRPGGLHIFQVPIRPGLFDEDMNPDLTATDREIRFGQHDHVRWFGDEDLQEQLLDHFAGFDRIALDGIVGRDELSKAGLRNSILTGYTSDTVFIFRKHPTA